MKKINALFRILSLSLVAVLLAGSLQFASLLPYQIDVIGWIGEHGALFAVSSAILFFIMLGLGALANNFYFAAAATSALIGILDFSQYRKLRLLGEPIYPWDLNQLKNWKEMLQIVRNIVSPELVIIAVLSIAALLAATFRLPRRRLKVRHRVGLLAASALVIYSSTHLQNPAFANSLEKIGATDYHWDQKTNYLQNGFLLAFLDNIGAKIENEPAGYSEEAIRQIVQKYSTPAGKTTNEAVAEQPNIVFVMDESLFDPTRLTGLTFSQDPMVNFHEDAAQVATGWSLSPVFGGGTSNVEFEALTGLSMSFINEGSVPYQQVLSERESFPSLVSLLKGRGYDTTAIHPFDKTFYNRNRVYPVLGFDRFISQDDIQYTDKLSDNGYISDMSAVKQAVDVLQSGDQPQFIHLVTMQNHLPIMYGMHGDNTISIDGLDGSGRSELETYAQGVKETDAAIQYLTDSIQQLDRPTIVVVFGDHLPSLEQGTYDQHTDGMTPEQKAKFLHETPLLVAANFPMDNKQLGTLSPSFFGPLVLGLSGQTMPAYYQLLEDVERQLPGVSPTVYVGADGQPEPSLTEEQRSLLREYELVQYDLLYGKGYAASMMK